MFKTKRKVPWMNIVNKVEISRFLFEGMIYGWKFVYTPSDVARGVEEYLEVVPIQEFGSGDVINYSDAFFENTGSIAV